MNWKPLVAGSFLLIGFIGSYFLYDSGFLDTLRYGSGTVSVSIEGTRFQETSLETTVRKGEKVVIVVRNRDEGRNHNFSLKSLNLETTVLRPGDTGIIEFTPQGPASYDFICTLHATKMAGVLNVAVTE